MTPHQLNPTPKQRFQTEENIKAHHALMENPHYQLAEDMARLHYDRVLAKNLAESKAQNWDSVANGLKLLGVQEYLNEFRMLAEKQSDPKGPGMARILDHDAN